MARRKLINSQLTNMATYYLYKRKMLTLAQNVFVIEGLPKMIDVAYLNQQLLLKGAVAFFKDDVLGVLALPYRILGTLDVYGRPLEIEVYGVGNAYRKKLKQGEFVIMYDNYGGSSIYLDICQSAERMALIKRTIDINTAQQKTPRIWHTKTENLKTVQDTLNEVDGFCEKVVTYDDLDLDETTCILSPAPYVADKLDQRRENEWNEFLQLIGVANLTVAKKERNITDEVKASMGGTIASRYSRFAPREKACEEINQMFGLDLKVTFYDGMPTTKEEGDDDDVDTLLNRTNEF